MPHLLAHGRVDEGQLFHLDARHAPVRIKIQQGRLAIKLGQRRIELRHGLYARKWLRMHLATAQVRQRRQRVAATAGHAHQLHRTQHGKHQAEGLGHPGVLRAALAHQQIHAIADEQHRPAQHLHGARQHGRDQPPGHAQLQHAKEALDGIHPGAGARQQGAGRDAHQQQRHAHAHRHGK